MQLKKAGGKVYGAVLTAAEKKAMDLEIQRELAEYDRKHIAEIDATILWVLHEQFGFGHSCSMTWRRILIFRRPSCLPLNAEEKMFQTGSSLNYRKHTASAICTLNHLSNT